MKKMYQLLNRRVHVTCQKLSNYFPIKVKSSSAKLKNQYKGFLNQIKAEGFVWLRLAPCNIMGYGLGRSLFLLCTLHVLTNGKKILMPLSINWHKMALFFHKKSHDI